MQCPFCTQTIAQGAQACSHCQRPYAPWVAWQLYQAFSALSAQRPADAKTAFAEALRVTPATEHSWVLRWLPPEFQLMPPPAPGAALKPQAAVAAAAVPFVSARARVPRTAQPESKHTTIALHFSVNDRPAEVLRVMESTAAQQRRVLLASDRLRPVVPSLLALGWLGFVTDTLAGYRSFVYGYFGVVCWLAAGLLHRALWQKRASLLAPGEPSGRNWGFIVFPGVLAILIVMGVFGDSVELTTAASFGFALLSYLWHRKRFARLQVPQGSPFDSRFDEARQVFEKLQDDLPRHAPLLGLLDLTGLHEEKVAQRARGANGAPLVSYRDEWLRLKLKLWDGNIVRVTAIEAVRQKQGFWKRGSSGKQKWKRGSSSAQHRLKVSVVVNKSAFAIRSPARQQQLDRLWVDTEVSADDRLVLSAYADQRFTAEHVLRVMKLAYQHVAPRA